MDGQRRRCCIGNGCHERQAARYEGDDSPARETIRNSGDRSARTRDAASNQRADEAGADERPTEPPGEVVVERAVLGTECCRATARAHDERERRTDNGTT